MSEEMVIEQLEDHIQGHINYCKDLMGSDFFGDDYPWEDEPEIKRLRKLINEAEMRKQDEEILLKYKDPALDARLKKWLISKGRSNLAEKLFGMEK
tara:strand:- start:1293 stop:1580 length:288 start_codon:yes stop_codon:yes gene_type:complete